MSNRWTPLAGCLLAIGGVGAAHAQVAPPVTHPSTLQDPQQRTERYYDQRQQGTQPEASTDPLKAPAPAGNAVPAGQGVHFVLHGVTFSDSSFLDDKALAAVARPYIGHDVDMADIRAIVDKVNALYGQQGITTARAVLGGQTIEGGVVHVELVEGRLGELVIQGNAHTREGFIRKRIHQPSGAVVDPAALRRDLVYLNRTTSLQVQALLRPGAGRGQTDVLLQATEPPRYALDGFVDNAGVQSTGTTRVGVQGHAYGLFGVSDLLDASLAHAKGGNDGSLSYSAIVNRRNGRLGFSYTQSQINILNGAFSDLDITGRSSVLALEYNQPFIATQDWVVSGVGAFSGSRSQTRVSGQSIADTHARAGSLGISVGHDGNDRQWSLTQVVTRVHSSEPLSDRTNFTLASGSFALLQRLGNGPYALRADAGWQYSAGEELPAANLFQVGGIGSVRGYERGILSGPRGYYVDLELHRQLGRGVDLYAFADHGAVYGAYPASGHLTGGGLGAALHYRSWLSASLDVARAFDTDVIPEQDTTRVDFRLAVHWQ